MLNFRVGGFLASPEGAVWSPIDVMSLDSVQPEQGTEPFASVYIQSWVKLVFRTGSVHNVYLMMHADDVNICAEHEAGRLIAISNSDMMFYSVQPF